MRLIAVDIGNSSTKIAPVETLTGSLGEVCAIDNRQPLESAPFEWLEANAGIAVETACCWVVCSVNTRRAEELQAWIRQHRSLDQLHLIQADEIPLQTDVASREALGRDRLLAAWQARQVHPEGGLVVIDAGTAVTVDLVSADSVLAGGVIFPGAKTMLRMLAQQTAALPDLSELGIKGALEPESNFLSPSKPDFPVTGKSTQQAILRGVYQTQLSTLKSIVAAHRAQSRSKLTVITTGGGLQELRPWLPPDWIHEPQLVLNGAAAIGRRLTQP